METLEDLAQEYRLRFESLALYRDQVWKVLTRDFFQEFVSDTATVLDLGAGWGEFINNIKAHRKYAMDLNEDVRGRLAPEVAFLLQDCSEPWDVPENTLDIVFTSNFFEHLATKDALRRTLTQALRSLKPGGRIVCLGPNIRFLPGTYWDFWDHYLPLTDRSLLEGLSLVGFAVERCIPRFLPYSMSQRFHPPVGLVSLYLRMPFIWPFFGKQFLVIGRKPFANES
jgi:SAM-dependent methyltransferase